MINYYQPHIFHFLRFARYTVPQNLKSYYYHSFEDGLWDLLSKKNIPKGSTILAPDFYCMDVLNNITNHGYQWQMYPLDQHFQVTPPTLQHHIQKQQPAIVIIFHVAGITSKVLQDHTWQSSLPENCLVIEDCVHRLLNPATISVLSANHLLLDSLRKVSPLPGSFMYGSNETLNFSQAPQTSMSMDLWKTWILYVFFRFCLEISFIFSLPKLTKFCFDVLLYHHDEIIGDSLKPLKGLFLIPWIHQLFDIEKIEQLKIKQCGLYQKLLRELLKKTKAVYSLTIPQTDHKYLHVYPLGLKKDSYDGLLPYLHSRGSIIWTKFIDCPWSTNQHVLFLPLGPQISDTEITQLCRDLTKWFSQKALDSTQK